MLFNLERDTGDTIEGYIVPDGFSEQPGLKVVDGGIVLAEMDCNEQRDAVVASGRHQTGRIGFRLDETLIPGLASKLDIDVVERETGLPIYRRRPADTVVAMKVVRIEHGLVPMTGLDRDLDPRFQYAIASVERFGNETTLQAFHLNAISSIYISGRIMIRAFEDFLERGFRAVMAISDPFEDMAERLVVLVRQGPQLSALGQRDAIAFLPAITHFAGVDLTSPAAVGKAIRSADEGTRRILTSPLTRLLASTTPDQPLTPMSAGQAIDMLSRFAVVGLRSQPETVCAPLAEMLNLPDALNVSPPDAETRALAGILRASREAERLLEHDLIVHHFVANAILAHAGPQARSMAAA